MHRPTEFEILYSDETGGPPTNLIELAEFSGATARAIDLDTFVAGGIDARQQQKPRCLGLSVRALEHLTKDLDCQTTELISQRLVVIGDEEPFDNLCYVARTAPWQVKILYLGAETEEQQGLEFFLKPAFPSTKRRLVEFLNWE